MLDFFFLIFNKKKIQFIFLLLLSIISYIQKAFTIWKWILFLHSFFCYQKQHQVVMKLYKVVIEILSF